MELGFLNDTKDPGQVLQLATLQSAIIEDRSVCSKQIRMSFMILLGGTQYQTMFRIIQEA